MRKGRHAEPSWAPRVIATSSYEILSNGLETATMDPSKPDELVENLRAVISDQSSRAIEGHNAITEKLGEPDHGPVPAGGQFCEARISRPPRTISRHGLG